MEHKGRQGRQEVLAPPEARVPGWATPSPAVEAGTAAEVEPAVPAAVAEAAMQ
ncbi:hypothetical protein [Sorangium sp. So ce388]|uniref:hypothetical protein n=1 Tax=Sorangium sp. So ce388 TaxID=3133309 RepID=UPI003F5C5769